MLEDAVRIDPEFLLQSRDQSFDGLDLSRCRANFLEVSDQTDSNSIFIKFTNSCMSSPALFLPAKGSRYLAIGHAVSISDDKVITDPLPGLAAGVPPLAMLVMDRFHTS